MSNPEKSNNFNTEEITLSLEILGSFNPYMEAVVSSYHNALKAHENADDLRQSLSDLTFPARGFSGRSYLTKLHENEIDIVLEGRNSDEAKTDYTLRLGFAIESREHFGDGIVLHGVFGRRAVIKSYDELKIGLDEELHKPSNPGEDVVSWSSMFLVREIEKVLVKNARSARAETLDIEFDSQGKKKDRLDEINHVMADFCLRLDQPELAIYFANQVIAVDKRISLYFSAVNLSNISGIKIVDLLSNLKDSLSPKELVRFLTLEISQQGLSGEIDIVENIKRVIILTNDKKLFNSSYRRAIRNKLIDTLAEVKQTNLADEVAKLCGSYKASERDGYVDSPYPERKVSRKERKRLKAIGETAISALEKSFQSSSGIDIITDRGSDIYDIIMDGYNYEEAAKLALYVRNFSKIPAWTGLTAEGLNYTPADREFQAIIADKTKGAFTKLIASAVMALNFTNLPEKQLDLEASISAALDELDLSIKSTVVSEDVYDQSIRRQQIEKQVKGLQARIDEINNVPLRARYTLKNRSLLDIELPK